MGKADNAALDFFSARERFADLMNFSFFAGKRVIKGEDLEATDSVFVARQRRHKKTRLDRVIVDKAMLWRGGCLRLLIQEY